MDATAKRKLPVGIQTFRLIREGGCYYVDKTALIQRLVAEGRHYFLSRPRRFGKSLLLDTVKVLFEGSEELFRGLAIHDEWDWQARHPVLRLDFGGGDFAEPGWLAEDATEQLDALARNADVDLGGGSAPARLRRLVAALHERTGRRVVVLVDEYDKPILDALETPQVARANRNFLRGLYAVVKSCDAHIRFSLLTGVSKFAKVSLFSGLNNLADITLEPAYSAICGYTDDDLDAVFAQELPGLDRQRIRRWYNGYSWLGEETVYNPFAILLLFDSRRFRAHWFETGSPKFLIDALLRRGVRTFDLEGMTSSEALLSAFDVDEMSTEALLFQTGYLTILDEAERDGRIRYRLGYPNYEVRQSLNERLLVALLPEGSRRTADAAPLRELLAARDFAGPEAFLPGPLRRHPLRVARPQRHRQGLLRQRVLLLLCRPGLGPGAGGELERPGGHGGARQRRRLRVRVQDRRWNPGRGGWERRSRRSSSGATRPSIGARAKRSTWWASPSAARAATSSASRRSGG